MTLGQLNIFNITTQEDMEEMYTIIGNMLSQKDINARHFWKKLVFPEKEENCFVTIWLSRDSSGQPLFFQMMLVPQGSCAGGEGSDTTASKLPGLKTDREPSSDASASVSQRTPASSTSHGYIPTLETASFRNGVGYSAQGFPGQGLSFSRPVTMQPQHHHQQQQLNQAAPMYRVDWPQHPYTNRHAVPVSLPSAGGHGAYFGMSGGRTYGMTVDGNMGLNLGDRQSGVGSGLPPPGHPQLHTHTFGAGRSLSMPFPENSAGPDPR